MKSESTIESPETIEIKDVESYAKIIRKFEKKLVIYRGISQESEMWPKIVRSFLKAMHIKSLSQIIKINSTMKK